MKEHQKQHFQITLSGILIKESPQRYLQEFFQVVVTKMQGGFVLLLCGNTICCPCASTEPPSY